MNWVLENPIIIVVCVVVFVILVWGVIIFCLIKTRKKGYNPNFEKEQKEIAEYKTKYIKDIIKEIFPEAQYEPDGFMGKEEFEKLEYFSKGTRFAGSDLLYGKSNSNIGFRYNEVDVLGESRDSDGSVSETHVFRGGIFSYKYPKSVQNYVLSKTKHMHAMYSWTRSWDIKRVETENVEFNKKMKTYSKDLEGVFYILTPVVQEEILEINKTYKQGVFVFFQENNIHIAVPNLDLFAVTKEDLKKQEITEDTKIKIKNDLDKINEVAQKFKIALEA